MNTCKKYQSIIKELTVRALNEEELTDLNEHCAVCPECNALFSIHNSLSEMEDPFPLADSGEFARIRHNVLRIARLNKYEKAEPIFDRLLVFIKNPAFSYGFAMLCLAAGLLIGNYLFIPPVDDSKLFVNQIEYIAAQNSDLRQIENSPYLYSNVTMEDMENDRIRLNFNVSTHIELVRPKTNPLVKEILAQSLINPEPMGYRIRNMEFAEKIIDPKIKEALIFSLQNDTALPVRMKALTILLQYRNDDEVQSALLKVIREEESVQMRLLAIDYLTENNIDASILNQAVESSDAAIKTPVKVKAQQYTNVKNYL